MRRNERSSLQQALKTTKKVLTTSEYSVSFLGSVMTRWGLRTTFLMGLIGAVGFGAHSVGSVFGRDIGYTLEEALKLPKITGLYLLAPGLFAKFAPRAFSSKLESAAQAEGLHLMEDYKKGHVWEHLDFLWERVFKPESFLNYTDKQRADEQAYVNRQFGKLNTLLRGIHDEELRTFLGSDTPKGFDRLAKGMVFANPFYERLVKTFEGFVFSSMFALGQPRSRSERNQDIGYGLGELVEWYNGALFDKTDTKIGEACSSDRDMKEIKSEISGYWRKDLKRLPRTLQRSLSFYLDMRMLATDLARQSDRLNRDYDTSQAGEHFTAQNILWPRDENLPWLEKVKPKHEGMPSAKEALLETRKRVIRNRFGETFGEAKAALDMDFLPDFENAIDLALSYDVEYAEDKTQREKYGMGKFGISYGLIEDLQDMGCCKRDICRYQKILDARRKELGDFVEYLARVKPGLFTFGGVKQLRAVKTAYHIDKWGMKKRFLGCKDADTLGSDIEKAISLEPVFTRRLTTSRFHLALSILQMRCYESLLKQLAYSGQEN